jgi:hypothetical protein
MDMPSLTIPIFWVFVLGYHAKFQSSPVLRWNDRNEQKLPHFREVILLNTASNLEAKKTHPRNLSALIN